MSDDLVNQLTLNFLISKNQLQKLNKKVKETSDQRRLREMQEYNERIKKLFCDLLVCQVPDDLLFEVKNTFDNFIEKSIYYFRAHDNNNKLEIERITNPKDDIQEDIDYEKEEREIKNGNYEEDENEEDENEEDENEEDENEEDENEDEHNSLQSNNSILHHPVIVKSKYKKTTTSVGVDDIQKLPVDWFQNVRQNYKKNQIIPRKKESTIVEQPLQNFKKKI
jgi:arsenate reductase-like glutaredoxin family protein